MVISYTNSLKIQNVVIVICQFKLANINLQCSFVYGMSKIILIIKKKISRAVHVWWKMDNYTCNRTLIYHFEKRIIQYVDMYVDVCMFVLVEWSHSYSNGSTANGRR